MKPDILISQGKSDNKVMGNLLGQRGVEDQLPAARTVRIGTGTTLWLPMDHPARHTAAIRESWPFYVQAIQQWKTNK